MTYLDLLIRIKQNAQPIIIELSLNSNHKLYYVWNGRNYVRGSVCGAEELKDKLTDAQMCTEDCIKALKYEEDENDISGSVE